MSLGKKYGFALPVMIAALALTPVLAAAQSGADIPRTAWGDPDLGGVWDYASITPMVRPEKYGDREFLTEEEVAELEAGAIERDRSAAEAPSTRAEKGDRGGASSHSFVWGLEARHRLHGRPADIPDHRPAQRPLPRADGVGEGRRGDAVWVQ